MAGGYPHCYRVQLAVGLFDHLTLGVTAHWLNGQRAPQVSPTIAIAFFRSRRVEVGAIYFQSLYPPPHPDDDPAAITFQPRVHWFLTTLSVSHRWLSGGADLGVLRSLDRDPADGSDAMGGNRAVPRWHPAGGAHLRAGTRRWGFTANVLAPRLYAEIVFDIRLRAFERRPPGGWSVTSVARANDRRVPVWR